MSQDIFGRRSLLFGGAFAADSARIDLNIECDVDGDGIIGPQDITQDDTIGLLTQQLNIQYQQPITRLYEVGTQLTYYVAGRPQGTATIARVLGPGNVMAELYSCLGDVCKAAKNDLCFCIQANCIGNPDQDFGAMQIGLKNVVLQGLGFSVAAADMVINEQMSLFFTALHCENTDACPQVQDIDSTPQCFS